MHKCIANRQANVLNTVVGCLLTATSSLNHFPFKHFAINSWVVSFHVFSTSFHSYRHSFLNQSVGGAFMELKGAMLTGSKLKSNKYWRGCECYCRTSSLNRHRFHNKSAFLHVFLPPRTVLMYKCVYIARVCVCLREGYCNSLQNYSSVAVQFCHYMCRIEVRLTVEEKGLCLAVKAKSVLCTLLHVQSSICATLLRL